MTKVEVQDYEIHNLAECSRHSQEQLRLCMGMSQAIAELSNVLAHKFNSLQWTLDQLQSQSGTLSAALPSMQEQTVFNGSTGGLIATSPSETPSRGTNASVPSGKRKRRGRLPAHTSKASTRAAAKAVRTKGRSRRQSSLVEGTRPVFKISELKNLQNKNAVETATRSMAKPPRKYRTRKAK